MRLSELSGRMRDVAILGAGDPDVSSITADSRTVGPGALFAAVRGSRDDGAKYIRDAVNRGAAAILAAGRPAFALPVPCLAAKNVEKALGEAADAFYGHPSRALALVGVTGTNGKTTTAYLLRHILNRAGMKTGMLGTIEYDLGKTVEPAPLTTPDAVRFTRSLAQMRDSGCCAAVAEVSSHALSQERVWPHRFACAVFTNLTRDHLDYHGDMDSYLAAKRVLFERLDAAAAAVLNLGDTAAARLSAGIAAKTAGYVLADSPAAGGGDRLAAFIVDGSLAGQTFAVSGMGMERKFRTPLVGRHNVENCLGALMAALALGVDVAAAADALADFPGVPGRLERLEAPSGAMVFVDYAHTDDALRSVLGVLRPLTPGRLIVVFGCGGDRDRGKRPLMARAAEALADMIVVTSDNPRSEDPEAIIRDIVSGFARPGRALVEPDRATAVRLAIAAAGAGDAVLVAGKGHENYQILGRGTIHLDDRELAREAFRPGKAEGKEEP